MNKNILVFTAGMCTGFFIAWRVLKTQYISLVEEVYPAKKSCSESGSVKPRSDEEPNKTHQNRDPSEIEDERLKEKYEKIASPYVGEDKSVQKEKNGGNIMNKKQLYIITPEEFGENEDYDTSSLYYYADGVLADVDDSPINDVDNTVGYDSLKTFGKYEDDAVYVRNDILKCDYEIMKSEQYYIDILKQTPLPYSTDEFNSIEGSE